MEQSSACKILDFVRLEQGALLSHLAPLLFTVRSDVEERVAEERLAWTDTNIPACCEILAHYILHSMI